MNDVSKEPLTGLRVLDLTQGIPGAYATKTLVDAGAEVIKLEPPEGDFLRRWSASGATIPDGEDGALFQFLSASKQSVAVDLKRKDDRDLVLRLAAVADLLVENFEPGVRDALGLSFETLQATNPALSLVSITPWGQTGPWATRPATEFTLQAAVGATAYRQYPGRIPVAAGGRIGEWLTGAYAAEGALLAWLSARKTGRGQHVDVSMFEAMVLAMTVYHDLSGQWRKEPLAGAIEVPSIEPAKDGWVGFCTNTGQQWKDFAALIGHPEAGDDLRFYDGTHRCQHLDYMQQIIHSWTLERSVDEIVEITNLMRIPCTPIGDGSNLPDRDHFKVRGVYAKAPGGFLQPRPPYLFERSALRPLGAAPHLGEHTKNARALLEKTKPASGEVRDGDPLPLKGLRVIELSTFWAGPIAGCHFADMGADVIKIESIQRPDGMRFAGAVANDLLWEWSPVFHGVNTGKRDLTLKLDDEAGRQLLLRLIENADVVIENFSARVLANFGLTWEGIHALNPHAILVRMPSFGLDGPWRDRTGFAMTVEQASGMAWVTGYEDLPLVPRGACDPLGGVNAVIATLLALEDRRRTGEGQLVEVPLVEGALNIAAEQVIEYSAYGKLLTRQENRGPCAAPQGVYRCDGDNVFVAVAVETQTQWKALCAKLERPDWESDSSLNTIEGRRTLHDEIDEAIERWTLQRKQVDAAEQLSAAGVPAEPLINAHFISPNPQLEARSFFQTMEHPITGSTRYPGLAMTFSGLPRAIHPSPPPTLGQDNEPILRQELGLSTEEIEDLRARKIVGERPSFM